MRNYRGPIRDEPLPIELHNTLYAVGGDVVDGLADAAGRRAWVGAIGDRLPFTAPKVDPSRFGAFDALREAVREVLHATLERRRPSKAALTELNRRCAPVVHRGASSCSSRSIRAASGARRNAAIAPARRAITHGNVVRIPLTRS